MMAGVRYGCGEALAVKPLLAQCLSIRGALAQTQQEEEGGKRGAGGSGGGWCVVRRLALAREVELEAAHRGRVAPRSDDEETGSRICRNTHWTIRACARRTEQPARCLFQRRVWTGKVYQLMYPFM